MPNARQPYTLPDTADADLESALRDFMPQSDLELYRYMEYQLGWTDDAGAPDGVPTGVDRRHGILCLHVAAAIGAPYDRVLRYAVSLELVQAFADIHGDVQDGIHESWGRPTVWYKWGPAQAINTGDGMHALARLALFQLTEHGEPAARVAQALEIVDDAILRMCEGEFMDVQMQEKLPVTAAEHAQMAELRVGSLFGAAAALPALHTADDDTDGVADNVANDQDVDDADGGADDGAVRHLQRFGRQIGVARRMEAERAAFFDAQLRDPIEQSRLVAKKKPLPVALLFDAVSEPAIQRQLGEIYMQRVIDPQQIQTIVDLASERDIDAAAQSQIAARVADAERALDACGIDGDAKSRLMQHAGNLVSRRRNQATEA